MRALVIVAVLITIIVIVYYYFPEENVIDWWVKQQPGSTTGTEMQQSDSPRGNLFQDMTLDSEGQSVMQGSSEKPAGGLYRGTPTPPASPVEPQQQLQPRANQPPPPPPRQPQSARLKIYQLAMQNDVRIISYSEPNIGDVVLSCQARDKNNIFDFMDAMERGISLRDIDNVGGGYKMEMAPDGTRIITATLKLKYIPEYQ